MSIEGSEAVKALAMARLREFGVSEGTEDAVSATEGTAIYAFLSHGSADAILADRLARDLMAEGIDVFLDQWDIKAGDSIPGKINEALSRATHFLVLLTPTSKGRAWVKAEMDAGLMQRVNGQCAFIALRHDVDASELPPLIRAWNCPSLDDYDTAVRQLISDIHGVSRRPPLGPVPAVVTTAQERQTGLSPAAFAIARLFIEQSKNGLTMDPFYGAEQFLEIAGLTDEDVRDGVHELAGRGFVNALRSSNGSPAGRAAGFHAIGAEAKLFAELDQYVMDWNPAQDAQQVAADLINNVVQGHSAQIAEHYGWPPRRLNPALSYLVSRRLVMSSRSSDPTWVTYWIRGTDDTRRFVKGRSL